MVPLMKRLLLLWEREGVLKSDEVWGPQDKNDDEGKEWDVGSVERDRAGILSAWFWNLLNIFDYHIKITSIDGRCRYNYCIQLQLNYLK